jgi:hypothetical protein
MEERNERIVRFGQPEISHYCEGCMRVFETADADGNVECRKSPHIQDPRILVDTHYRHMSTGHV